MRVTYTVCISRALSSIPPVRESPIHLPTPSSFAERPNDSHVNAALAPSVSQFPAAFRVFLTTSVGRSNSVKSRRTRRTGRKDVGRLAFHVLFFNRNCTVFIPSSRRQRFIFSISIFPSCFQVRQSNNRIRRAIVKIALSTRDL
jgi:hypothetical protein